MNTLPYRQIHSAIVCKYQSFVDPLLKKNFRLPLVHVRLKFGTKALKTDALVDSGATGTFMPIDYAEMLGLVLKDTASEARGAGGLFKTAQSKVDLVEILKGSTVFCRLENVDVHVTVASGAIPHVVLGRDTIFRKFDITYREHKEQMVFRPPKH